MGCQVNTKYGTIYVMIRPFRIDIKIKDKELFNCVNTINIINKKDIIEFSYLLSLLKSFPNSINDKINITDNIELTDYSVKYNQNIGRQLSKLSVTLSKMGDAYSSYSLGIVNINKTYFKIEYINNNKVNSASSYIPRSTSIKFN